MERAERALSQFTKPHTNDLVLIDDSSDEENPADPDI